MLRTAAYLRRLGLAPDLPPTLDSLVTLHRAHLQQVPYENLETMLGRPPSVLPADSLERIVRVGRAGYCFHHNGALEMVLRELGYSVERRFGHVWTRDEDRAGAELNHLVLVVTGLPTTTSPQGRWWVDAGLGEGPLDPVPVVDGEVADGPFRFVLSDATERSWSFRNDPTGSFTGLEVRDRPAPHAEVAAAHAALTKPPDGAFTRVLVAQRRDPAGSDTVRCCVATRVDGDGVHRKDLTSYDDWRDALTAVGLPLADVGEVELRGLFDRMSTAHRAWDGAGRP